MECLAGAAATILLAAQSCLHGKRNYKQLSLLEKVDHLQVKLLTRA